ncbi:MAG: hypothetical protein ACRDYA_11745 [Egibacteraceae bacterium]
MEEMLALLAKDGLEMCLPKGTLRTEAEFRHWYQNQVIYRYFDEVHEIEELTITPIGDTANVKVVLNWYRRTWDPPKAKSTWLAFDVYQTWVVQRSPTSGRPVILTYIVDALTPRDGVPQHEECWA